MKKIYSHLNNIQSLLALSLKNKEAAKIIRCVRKEKLTYLDTMALVDLFTRVEQVEAQKLDGVLIEAGCALGGSALVMANGKLAKRTLYLYDAFGLIPPPTQDDGFDAHQRFSLIESGKAQGFKGDTYYGYQDNLLEQVKETFARFDFQLDTENIKFVKGFYEDTLNIEQSVALAHIDCDWYESVLTCLRRIEPWLVSGGILIIDDYLDWSGCRRAVDTYFEDKKQGFSFEMRSRLHIIKH